MHSQFTRAGLVALLSAVLWSATPTQAHADGTIQIYVPEGVGPSHGIRYSINGQWQDRHPQGEYRTHDYEGRVARIKFHTGGYKDDGSPRFNTYRAKNGTHAFGTSPRGTLYMYRDEEPHPNQRGVPNSPNGQNGGFGATGQRRR